MLRCRLQRRVWREPTELALIAAARNGDERAMDDIIRRYEGFVRLKASSYFLAGGDSHDLIQEGLVGLFKAVRDFRADKETSFRSFAELCITRQIITAIKTATRYKHAPLNSYVSFSHTPAGQEADADCTLGDALPGPAVDDPATLRDLDRGAAEPARTASAASLSSLESQVLTCYLEGRSYEEIGESLDCDPKTVDNALQRVKRKVLAHLQARRIAG